MEEKCTYKFGMVQHLHKTHGNSTAYFPNEDGEITIVSLTNNTYKDGLKYNKL